MSDYDRVYGPDGREWGCRLSPGPGSLRCEKCPEGKEKAAVWELWYAEDREELEEMDLCGDCLERFERDGDRWRRENKNGTL